MKSKTILLRFRGWRTPHANVGGLRKDHDIVGPRGARNLETKIAFARVVTETPPVSRSLERRAAGNVADAETLQIAHGSAAPAGTRRS